MTTGRAATALLLAAHGERRVGATDDGARRLAAALSARNVADEVGVGFINGTPAIGEAIRAFEAKRIVVYPLFLSDGYFTRVRLAQLLDEARQEDGRRIWHMLPPLGLDPGLADLIAEQAPAARPPGFTRSAVDLVLLAHGSTTDPASRIAAERLAAQVAMRGGFRAVHCAFLDEGPCLRQATADLSAPVTVVGLFAGDGIHGGRDVPRLIAQLGRDDVVFAGTIARLEGIEQLVAAAVGQALGDAPKA